MLDRINHSSTLRRNPAHKHHTHNTTHSFPLVTCAGHQQPCAALTVVATSCNGTSRAASSSSTATTRKQIRQQRQQAQNNEQGNTQQETNSNTAHLPTHYKKKRAAGTPDKRVKKKIEPTLSAHINPWTISSGLLRTQSLRATTEAAAAREMPP